jgi:alpha-beta hydrolase superfamily lysophospholipase
VRNETTESSVHPLIDSIAQQQNGTTIVLEHRFYGLSNPLPDLSVKSLRLHTIQQAIDDLEYFAENVNLPMPSGDSLTPDKAPWILIGGSYGGTPNLLFRLHPSPSHVVLEAPLRAGPWLSGLHHIRRCLH